MDNNINIGVRSWGVSNKGVSGESSMLNARSSVSRHRYAAPSTEVIRIDDRPVMYTVSPGIGGSWNPGDDIDAKGIDALEHLPTEFSDPWEE